MSIDKMDQIVEALEAAIGYIRESPCDPDIYEAQREAWARLQAADAEGALALAQELRANAVEVVVEDCMDTDDHACSCAKAHTYELHKACGHVYNLGPHALLIVEPTEDKP